MAADSKRALRRVQLGVGPRHPIWVADARIKGREHLDVVACDRLVGVRPPPRRRQRGGKVGESVAEPRGLVLGFVK